MEANNLINELLSTLIFLSKSDMNEEKPQLPKSHTENRCHPTREDCYLPKHLQRLS